MLETATVTDIGEELRRAEAQAAELWRQAEQICAVYRVAVQQADQLREQTRGSEQRVGERVLGT